MKNESQFWAGAKDCLPIMFAVCFFAMLFGATGVNNGAPVWSILLAVFAINFRHVLYSASLGRYMGSFSFTQKYSAFFLLCDPLFGAGEIRAQKQALKPSYYFGYGIPLYIIWLVFTALGADRFGFDLQNDRFALAHHVWCTCRNCFGCDDW